jgi:hypothetical protein
VQVCFTFALTSAYTDGNILNGQTYSRVELIYALNSINFLCNIFVISLIFNMLQFALILGLFLHYIVFCTLCSRFETFLVFLFLYLGNVLLKLIPISLSDYLLVIWLLFYLLCVCFESS